jgi:hypothetical protein
MVLGNDRRIASKNVGYCKMTPISGVLIEPKPQGGVTANIGLPGDGPYSY